VSFGGFGVGWIYDLFNLSRYVDIANMDPAVRHLHADYATSKKRSRELQWLVATPTVEPTETYCKQKRDRGKEKLDIVLYKCRLRAGLALLLPIFALASSNQASHTLVTSITL
jgi:hypothetical protein